jgi:anti-sigma B factor antagonist
MPSQLEISQRETEQGVAVIRVAGRVMLGDESARIETMVEELLDKGTKRIVFDLSGVDHMDSTGIGRFISSLNKVMRAGGKLRMAAAGRMVREGFRVTRLDTVFEFFDEVDSACQDFD